eukprot:235919-Prymnesium_polylepis.1
MLVIQRNTKLSYMAVRASSTPLCISDGSSWYAVSPGKLSVTVARQAPCSRSARRSSAGREGVWGTWCPASVASSRRPAAARRRPRD